jgi:hypothetical protein
MARGCDAFQFTGVVTGITGWRKPAMHDKWDIASGFAPRNDNGLNW